MDTRQAKPIILTIPAFEDFRGYLAVPYDQSINFSVRQINQGFSKKAGTLRGLHFQDGEYAQAKLVSCLHGSIFNVAVDLRKDSQTYGKWYGVELTEENKKQFYVPEGFAHGYLVLSDSAEFCYKCTDFYHPGDEGGLLWSDPEIGVEWPIEPGMELIISEKDKKWSGLKDTFKF